MTFGNTSRKTVWLWGIAVALFCLYGLISFVNHYLFRTYSYDLGFMSKAVYDYSRLQFSDFTLFYWRSENTSALADHFDLLLILLSPLRYIFGNWTLLVCQVAAIVFGAFGMYRFVASHTSSSVLPFLAMLQFGLTWGNFAAVSFDYHTSVMASMFIPWFVYYFSAGRFRITLLLYFLVLVSKENLSLWMAAISAGLALIHFRDRKKLVLALSLMGFAVFFFLLVINVIMPAISGTKNSSFYFKYGVLGKNFRDLIGNVFSDPWNAIRLVFVNHSGDAQMDWIKGEFLMVFAWSGGIVMLLRPQFLVMAIPIVLQKVWHNSSSIWGLTHHYSIEMVPLISLAVWHFVVKLKERKWQIRAGIAGLVLTCSASLYFFEFRIPVHDHPNKYRFYSSIHYKQPEFDAGAVREALQKVPDDAKVSAQGIAVPHLAMRKTIYLFPRIEDAEYLFLINSRFVFPLSPKDFRLKLAEIRASDKWTVVYEKNPAIVFKRKNQSPD